MTWADLHEALRARGLVDAVGVPPRPAPTVTGVSYDSRRVEKDHVFVALKGLREDGTSFARHAIERGASVVISEDLPAFEPGVLWVKVENARLALAALAATYHRHPSGEIRVIGITGTNGKTTTAHLIASIFESAGMRCGILGTVGYRLADELRQATHTTPEASEVQGLLREMADRGVGACAMEVSSHALALHRVDETIFAAGVFTNLTRDHLDFHGSMDAYFQAKRRLFEMLPDGAPALINLDDPRGAILADVVARPVTYAVDRPADLTPGPLSFSLDGLAFDVRTPRGTIRVRSSLVGRPNVYNIMAAVSVGTALDLSFAAIERGVSALKGVPGRFEVVSGPGDAVTVVVDYAHTDDALRNLLETARPLARARLITVFGCGGDSDRTKRPLMGAVADRLSDVVLITSDNPRSEDPVRIIDEIRRGIRAGGRPEGAQGPLTIVDRHDAIWKAIELARPGDVVLIAGKGHEKHQVIGDQVLPFDDVAIAREALARRRSNSGVV
jgi:UDP-N-acetylmuramoyl-L-alanyl-D-glutamate--2,6-diaminopimelate ligase